VTAGSQQTTHIIPSRV